MGKLNEFKDLFEDVAALAGFGQTTSGDPPRISRKRGESAPPGNPEAARVIREIEKDVETLIERLRRFLSSIDEWRDEAEFGKATKFEERR